MWKFFRYPEVFAIALILGLVLCTENAKADEFDRPITGGTVTCIGQIGPITVGATPTVSISFENVATQARVFCMAVDAAGFVSGESDLIPAGAEAVILAAYAHGGVNCDGLKSDASDDRYRVSFANPTKPILLLVMPPNP